MGDVVVLGVRHHGPGSARAVGEALAELRPDAVLIEGAPELDSVAALAGGPDMVPPVAGLVYAVDEPRRSAFYPLADFSPEWVALRWALQQGNVVPIPRSSHPERVAENVDIFDFTLSDADMQRIDALKRPGSRIADPVGRAPARGARRRQRVPARDRARRR